MFINHHIWKDFLGRVLKRATHFATQMIDELCHLHLGHTLLSFGLGER